MRLTPEEAERLLSGGVSRDDPRLGPLAEVLGSVRATFERSPDASLRAAHLHAMADAFAGPPTPRRRRVPVARRRRFLEAAVAAGGVVAVSAVLAVAGTLGRPAQNVVADAARLAGVDLPGGSDDLSPTPVVRGGSEGQGTAEAQANRERAALFTDAKQEWTSCVAELAVDKEGTPFDPEAEPPDGCGPKPTPAAAVESAVAAEATANPAGHVPGTGDAGIDEGNVGLGSEITVVTTTPPEDQQDREQGGQKGRHAGRGAGRGQGQNPEGSDATTVHGDVHVKVATDS